MPNPLKPIVQFALLQPGAILPKRATPGAGAFDLFAPEGGQLFPYSKVKISTGVAHQINDEFIPGFPDFQLQGFMISRSGLASNEGIRLLWQGLIDHDYRGEIHVHLENFGGGQFHWNAGDRLCQIAYSMCFVGDAGEIHESELIKTVRGAGGHGSTGR